MADMAVSKLGIFLSLVSFVYGNSQRLENYGSFYTAATKGWPWPLPQYFISIDATAPLNAEQFQFVPQGFNCDILEEAFARYRFLTFPSLKESATKRSGRDNTLRFKPHRLPANGEAILGSLSVDIKSACDGKIYPALESDESYNLNIDEDGAFLVANTIWGGLRGLETFSQLVWQDDFLLYRLNFSTTQDYPRFAHRGTLLDSSRHYLSVQKIQEHLEAMAQNKMNVLHWHIVDDQSFPYESATFPEMSVKAAFSPNHVYTQEDVLNIIEFARLRGIRVVPEYDSPGHTESWGVSQPGLLTSCYTGGKPNGAYGPIDPSVNTTYTFLEKFFREIATLFPDKYIHMGGDEVSFSCWQSNPLITEFMKLKNYGTDYSKLEEYYMENLLGLISSFQKGYIIWQEVIDNGVKVRPDTVVEVWKGGYEAEMAKVTSLGYRTLLSTCWYLNYISYGSDWEAYYKCDPHSFNGTAEQKKLVVGGEACMWGEYVDDVNLISRFWPRAASVAERLWSAQTVTDAVAAAPRIVEHTCRLRRRGLQAEPIAGPSYCPHEVPPRP